METETKTRAVTITADPVEVDRLTLFVPAGPGPADAPMRLGMTTAELQAIVQAAYDQHGILAVPSVRVEVERVAAGHPGLCRCGLPGCSDRDQALQAFADAWGNSLRGRA